MEQLADPDHSLNPCIVALAEITARMVINTRPRIFFRLGPPLVSFLFILFFPPVCPARYVEEATVSVRGLGAAASRSPAGFSRFRFAESAP